MLIAHSATTIRISSFKSTFNTQTPHYSETQRRSYNAYAWVSLFRATVRPFTVVVVLALEDTITETAVAPDESSLRIWSDKKSPRKLEVPVISIVLSSPSTDIDSKISPCCSTANN